ncbi:MAG: hypothetical protein JKY08_09465 [Flavobacteriaceae bacterium]|nr:hypothetical protein [Flavobacteriaceae bacterium]
MSNIKFIITVLLIGFINISYSQIPENNQIYQTYTTDSIPYHLLIIKNNKLIIEIPRKNDITFGSRTLFNIRTEKDTIFIINKLISDTKKEGIVILNSFTKHFVNTKIYKKSNNKLFFLNQNRPYFKKKLVGNLIGDNTIYYINGRLFKVPINSSKNQININKILKKPKRAKFKMLKGKQAYEKYGIIGLNGVIEISDRKRCYK